MRGIAMLLVVLGHTMTGCTVNSQDSFLFNIIWSLQMPLFILISGYVTRYSKKISNRSMLWFYVKRRTIAYLLPWTVWTFLIRGLLFGKVENFNLKQIFWNTDSGYWFLVTIWTISLIYGVASFCAHRRTTQKASCVNSAFKDVVCTGVFYAIGVAILLLIGLTMGFSFFCIKLTLYYMPFYFVGYVYGTFQDQINENEKGKLLTQIVIAVSLFVWVAIILRINLYAIADSGMGILIRAFASLTGCIAICGLCSGLLGRNSGGGGYPLLVRNSFAGDLSHTLFIVKLTETRNNDGSQLDCGSCNNSSELHRDGNTNSFCGATSERELCFEASIIRKNTIAEILSNAFQWSGTHSLEIYMLHGLYLSVVKMMNMPEFMTYQGCFLAFGNYLLTVVLTCGTVALLNQSRVLSFVLFGKNKFRV